MSPGRSPNDCTTPLTVETTLVSARCFISVSSFRCCASTSARAASMSSLRVPFCRMRRSSAEAFAFVAASSASSFGDDAVAIEALLPAALDFIVAGDRRGFRDLLGPRTGDRFRERGLRGVDRGALLAELAVDGLGLERHQQLAGIDVHPFIDERLGDAAADERSDVDRPRFERSAEDDFLRLLRVAVVEECADGGDRRGRSPRRRSVFSCGHARIIRERSRGERGGAEKRKAAGRNRRPHVKTEKTRTLPSPRTAGCAGRTRAWPTRTGWSRPAA